MMRQSFTGAEYVPAMRRTMLDDIRATKSAGQLAYEEDCQRRPFYDDGTARRPWDSLSAAYQDTWHRNPTPREWP